MSDDPALLAALHATLGATHRYPKKIGNREIPLSVALNFSPEARELVNEITEPSCFNRMYGRGAHTLTTDQIAGLHRHMPSGFMDGTRVTQETNFCCDDGTIYGCAVMPGVGLCVGGTAEAVGCCVKNTIMMEVAGWFICGSCGGCCLLGFLKLTYPCVCRERKQYVFGHGKKESSDSEDNQISLESDSD